MNQNADVALRSTNGPNAGVLLPLAHSVVTVGRRKANQICLDDSSVSREHCEIVVTGEMQIRDLGSRHGTYVNAERVEDTHPLSVGDKLQFGRLTFDFVGGLEEQLEQTLQQSLQTSAEPNPAEATAPSAPETHFTFCALNGAMAGRRFALEGSQAFLGRSGECEVQIDVKGLSRKHCELTVADERLFVKDLGSKHGTFVNDVRVRDNLRVADGDLLRLGRFVLRVSTNGAAVPEDAHQAATEDNAGAVSQSVPGVSLAGMSLDGISMDGMSFDGMSLEDMDLEDVNLGSDTDEHPKPSDSWDSDAEPAAEEREATEVELHQRGTALLATLLIEDLADKEALKRIKEKTAEQLNGEHTVLIVDCRHLLDKPTVDFWRTLVDLKKAAGKQKTPLRLCQLEEDMHEALSATSFSRLLPVFESLRDAIEGERQDDPKRSKKSKREEKSENKESRAGYLEFLNRVSNTTIIAVVVGLVLLALGANLVVLMLFSGASLRREPPDRWKTAAVGTVAGQMIEESSIKPGLCYAVGWPTSQIPEEKFRLTSSSLRESKEAQTSPSSSMGPFTTRSNEQGTFTLEVPAPQVDTVYQVLIISDAERRTRPLSGGDLTLLSRFFEDPNALVATSKFALVRLKVSPGVTAEATYTFEVPSSEPTE